MASASTSVDAELQSPEPKQPRTETQVTDTTNESDHGDEWEMLMEDIYTQDHFDTTADEIVDIIFNTSLQHLTTLIPSMKQALLPLYLPDGSDKEQAAVASAKVDAGLAKYIENFYATLERNSDALLLYLKRNIISVPENVVLPHDNIQVAYKELVKSLQAKKLIFHDAGEPDYTEENTADLLAEKAEKLREKLLQRKLERVKFEHQTRRADAILHRLNSIENKLESTFGEIPGSVREYILKNIAAAFELPVLNGSKLPNGGT